MSKRDREIREMIERAWEEEERKEREHKGFLNFNENDMRLLEEYYAIGLPYGNSPEGFNRWLEERD
jgi:hypothetical protein